MDFTRGTNPTSLGAESSITERRITMTTRYEAEFYNDIKQLVKTQKEILAELKIKNSLELAKMSYEVGLMEKEDYKTTIKTILIGKK